jgi:hypothetical protein
MLRILSLSSQLSTWATRRCLTQHHAQKFQKNTGLRILRHPHVPRVARPSRSSTILFLYFIDCWLDHVQAGRRRIVGQDNRLKPNGTRFGVQLSPRLAEVKLRKSHLVQSPSCFLTGPRRNIPTYPPTYHRCRIGRKNLIAVFGAKNSFLALTRFWHCTRVDYPSFWHFLRSLYSRFVTPMILNLPSYYLV